MTDAVTILGGLEGGDTAYATAGGALLLRHPGEPLAGFQARVMDVARDAGERHVVFGGLPETRLPTLAELTDQDRAGIDRIVQQAEGLADLILGADEPHAWHVRALQGLQNLAAGSGLYTLPPRCIDALNRLPAAADVAAWQARQDRMDALAGRTV